MMEFDWKKYQKLIKGGKPPHTYMYFVVCGRIKTLSFAVCVSR